jgi:hypothetical protein
VRSLNKYVWYGPGLILLLAFLVFSCKDDDNELGLNIQPPGDKLNLVYSDTTKIVAYSQLVDSVRSDETSVSLLGSIMDPVFGQSTASFYTQFRLSKSSFSYGTNPTADSLILSLFYKKQYGDSLSPLTLRIYEMSEQINIDSSYYSNQAVDVYPTLLAQKTFVPNYIDSVIVGTDTLLPHLRINMGELTSELITKLLSIPSDTMATNESFLNYFYGLYITVEPVNSQGQVIYFDLLSSITRMTMYYHNDSDDSLAFAYVINSNCARFGHFDHDYSFADASFKAQVLDKDTTLGNQTCYVQSLAGVKTFLRFPNLRNYYANGKIAVNEARLFIKGYEIDPYLQAATNLIMVKKTDTGGYAILEDQLEGSDYYGGDYNEDDNGYWFRITMTVQDLMRADTLVNDNGLEIYMSGGAVNAERILLTGTDPQSPALPEDRFRLVITYTKL